MNEQPKTKWRWRLLRWGLIALAILITLLAILVTEENWRIKRDWLQFKRTAEARGERFDLAAVVPAAVPDDQNFFSTPLVAEAWRQLQHIGGDRSPESAPRPASRMDFNIYRGESTNWPSHAANWQKGQLTDLKEWQEYFRRFSETPEGRTNGFPVATQPQTPAADVLLALSRYDTALAELRAASLRPYARIPLNYDDGFEAAGRLLPWLAKMKTCAQFLELRSLAELQNHQGGEALADVQLLLRVSDCVREQPFLISHLVRIAMTAITLQTVYEGLAQRVWTDTQLAELERTLAKQDFLADYQFAMRGEKIFALATFEKQRITREMKSVEESHGTNKITTISFRFMPSAFFYGNELAFAQLHADYIAPLVDLTNRTVSVAGYRKADADIKQRLKHYSPYTVQALMVFPAVSKSVLKFALIQSQVDLARVACALERHRLAKGNFPDTLDVLVPQFIAKLPHDVINGQPLHYRRTDDGKFVLFSVGWDEQDDGGKVFFTKGGAVDREKGDWVWQY